ncbi:MAG: ABC transporter permease [Treponema sp.]|nr:ABC transporter permease [Treponema sp.]
MVKLPANIQTLFYKLGFFARTLVAVGAFIKLRHVSSRVLIMQIYFTFVQAMGISTMLALGIGAAVSIIGFPFLMGLGQQHLIYPLLIVIVTTELGPLLMAFIVTARSATAIATEVAGMVISHEVEAYISVGIDPIEHLAVPRFIGVTVSLLLLNIYFSVFGLAGSFVIVQMFHHIPADYYFSSLVQSLTIQDLSIVFIKSIAFGMIISTVAITEGLNVERASTEVPVAGLRAVSKAFAACVAANIALSALYYTVLV